MGRVELVDKTLRTKRSWATICLVLVVLAGCGGTQGANGMSQEAGRILTEEQAKVAIQRLPYVYEFRSVKLPARATGALAGEARGPDHVHVQFGISLGRHAAAVPVPRSGILNTTGVPSAGFTFTNDLLIEVGNHKYRINPDIHNLKQEHIAVVMMNDMEEALCLAAIGRLCGI